MKKPVFQIALILILLFASHWSFNHVDAWVGFGGYVLTAVYAVSLIINFLKKAI